MSRALQYLRKFLLPVWGAWMEHLLTLPAALVLCGALAVGASFGNNGLKCLLRCGTINTVRVETSGCGSENKVNLYSSHKENSKLFILINRGNEEGLHTLSASFLRELAKFTVTLLKEVSFGRGAGVCLETGALFTCLD